MHSRSFFSVASALVVALMPLLGAANDTRPLGFTRNMGQWPDSSLFRASAGGTVMWFVKDGIYYQFTRRIPKANSAGAPHSREGGIPVPSDKFSQGQDSIEFAMVKAQFVGASQKTEIVGLDEQDYKCNYFLGSDPGKWHTDVSNYSAVAYKNVYPGVDATFRGQDGRLGCELHGTAQAISRVKTDLLGGVVTAEADNTTAILTNVGEKRFKGMLPVFDAVPVTTALDPGTTSTVTLAYSTYLGGTISDYGTAIAVNSTGNAYMAGETWSADFPTQNPYQMDHPNADIFVTKFAPSGNSLVYSTYLGGSSIDLCMAVALDASENLYLSGETVSSDYPTQNPYQPYQDSTHNSDALVTKLSPAGNSLVYSTCLGGNGPDKALSIAVDNTGSAYLAGCTKSANFPTKTPVQATYGGGAGLYGDGFVAKLSAAGNSVIYSTFLGGADDDGASGIAFDAQGNAYVAGVTSSYNFPTQSPYQAALGSAGTYDAFVSKLSPTGTSLVFSTYLGGTGRDEGTDIAVDATSNVYVVGSTASANFPTKTPYQTYQGPSTYYDVFITKFAPTGTSLIYSTYLGGNDGDDYGSAVFVDAVGCAYLTGYILSTNFPVKDAYQANFAGGNFDAFAMMLSSAGNGLVYSTYLGGGDSDQGMDIVADAQGNAYITGSSSSYDYPTQNAYQPYFNEVRDAVITKLAPSCCIGTRGNVNMVGIIDLSDVSWLIAYLTRPDRPVLPCPEAANVNAVGIIDLSDLSWLVNYLTVKPQITLPNCP